MLLGSISNSATLLCKDYTLCCHLLNIGGSVKQTPKVFEMFYSTHETYFNGAFNSPKAGKKIGALYQYK